MKISSKELTNVKPFEKQGLSLCQIYEAFYKGEAVVIKAQKQGSLKNTNPKDDRFIQELKYLELHIEGMVELKGWGDDFEGERFLVLEQLYPLPETLSHRQVPVLIENIIRVSRKLYLHGFNWVAVPKHVMVNKECIPKLIDFNDDKMPARSFFNRAMNVDALKLCKILEDKYGISVYEHNTAFDKIIEEEYQSLKNVHQPIFFPPYKDFYRTETEPDDPKYLKLVPPNRQCTDRADDIMEAIADIPSDSNCLDIGCNIGWFTFLLQEHGFETTGVDFDKEKIEFAKLVGEKEGLLPVFEFANVSVNYMKTIPSYDIILVLSILHLYFTQHKVSKDYWFQLFKGICDKVNNILIFETSKNILRRIGASSFDDFARIAKEIGNFKSSEILGVSDANRPLIMCKR